MPGILLTNHYDEKVLKILKDVVPDNFELITLDTTDREELLQKIKYAEYLLVSGRMKIDRQLLDAAERLKMIQRTGVGLDSLDLDAINEKGIPLYVNSGVNARSVAEHTVLLILALLRRLTEADSNMHNGVWKKQAFGINTNELYNKKVGLIGLGNIGRTVAGYLNAFGAEVMYYDSYPLDESLEKSINVKYREFDELMRCADIISLHCPLNESTGHLINRDILNTVKKGLLIVNTARGGLIDEKALVDCIRNGTVGGAALDVFENEPLSGESPLIDMKNVILTSHIGGVTYESFLSMMQGAMYNIENYEKGKFDLIEKRKWNR